MYKFPFHKCAKCGKRIPKGLTASGEEVDKGMALYSPTSGVLQIWHFECFENGSLATVKEGK